MEHPTPKGRVRFSTATLAHNAQASGAPVPVDRAKDALKVLQGRACPNGAAGLAPERPLQRGGDHRSPVRQGRAEATNDSPVW